MTIEDILEELVGDISDEHEPMAPAMFKQLTDGCPKPTPGCTSVSSTAGSRLNLPEDAGYDTLGGFVSTTLGRIPQLGATLEQGGVRFTVIEAEPQRVKRMRARDAPIRTCATAGRPRVLIIPVQ